MVMLSIDGVHVIFEGARRLRWERRPSWPSPAGAGQQPWPDDLVVGHVWPEQNLQPRLRREIEHGQRTLVVLDGCDPVITLPRSKMPNVPTGAKVLSVCDEGIQTVLIPPFTWLGPADRARGETFLSRANEIVGNVLQQSLRPHHLLEEDLLGTAVPLRFVYREQAFTISELRSLIRRLYWPTVRVAIPVLHAGGHRVDSRVATNVTQRAA